MAGPTRAARPSNGLASPASSSSSSTPTRIPSAKLAAPAAAARSPLSSADPNKARGPTQLPIKKGGAMGAPAPRRAAAPRRIVDDEDDGDDTIGERDDSFDTARTVSHPRIPSGMSAAGIRSRMASASSNRDPLSSSLSHGGPSSGGHLGSSRGNPSSSSAATSASNGAAGRPQGGVAALARRGPRKSLRASLGAAAGVAQHESSAREVVKLNVDSTSFEEWMKMATDNKINASNTWSFALIDYFHDMSLLRSETGDGSINFQKASCTLDGCIKVWTSRVDSVVVETGKLLSGLQEDLNGAKDKKKGKGGDDDDDDGDGEVEMDEDGNPIPSQGGKKKRSKSKEATLVKNFSQLAVKKLELEFTVDPLFKKTSADFDEGGAGGLLMNHLGVDGKMRIVFDASDVAGIAEEGADVVEGVEEPALEAAPGADEMIDVSKIRTRLFGDDEAAFAESDNALEELLSNKTVCPTFSAFRFAPDDDTPFGALLGDHDPAPGLGLALAHDDDDGAAMDMPDFDDGPDDLGEGDAPLDFFGADGGADGFGGDDDDGPTDLAYFSGAAGNTGMYESAAGLQGMGGAPLAPGRPAERDLAMAFHGITDGGVQGEDEEGEGGAQGIFDYFDQRLMKNWAGPEHWKMRKGLAGLGAPPGQRKPDGEDGQPSSATKTTRKSKEPFVIDFSSDEGAVSSKELFESAKTASTIMLPKAKGRRDVHLLPEDRHFSSRRLLRLFIKPRAMLNMRRRGPRIGQAEEEGLHPADLDEQFWAEAAAARGNDLGGADVGFDDGAGAAFDAPFYDDDGAFDGLDGPGGMPGDSRAVNADYDIEDEELASQALKQRVKPEFVNYAKRAKKVDVKKLKENIWRELAIQVQGDVVDDDEGESEDDDAGPTTPRRSATPSTQAGKDDVRTFDSVLAGLRRAYPKDKMDEISTSFCFICLLHLANEEGLEIQKQLPPRSLEAMSRASSVMPLSTPNGGSADGLGTKELNAVFDNLARSGRMAGMDEEEEDEDEPGQGGAANGEELVGHLEMLRIRKDPTAGRSA